MKRTICLLLALLFLLPTVACTSSTGSTDTSAPTSSSAVTEDETDPDGETTSQPPDTAGRTYEKKEFRMASYVGAGSWYYANETGINTLNDAIYEMNQLVENALKVTLVYNQIQCVTGGELYAAVQPSIMTGDDTYQLCILHPYESYNSFILNNQAFDLYTLENVDMEQSYWNKNVIDQLAVGDHAYIGSGALCKYDLYMIYCNKDVLTDAGKTVPYDLVREQKWTLDTFLSMTQDFYADDNGDGRRDNGDKYGFAGMWDANSSAFLQASDIYIVTKDETKSFVVTIGEHPHISDFYDKLFTWSKDESVWLYGFASRNNTSSVTSFLSGKIAFTLDILGTQYNSASFDVGILPMPKYSEAQENYQHVNWGNNIIVPSTISNASMVGDTLELMAYYSSTVVHSAYYETVLQYQAAADQEDSEMVVLIYNTVVYDPGIAFCDGNTYLWNLVYLPAFGLLNNSSKLGSTLKSNVKSAQRTLNQSLNKKIYD